MGAAGADNYILGEVYFNSYYHILLTNYRGEFIYMCTQHYKCAQQHRRTRLR